MMGVWGFALLFFVGRDGWPAMVCLLGLLFFWGIFFRHHLAHGVGVLNWEGVGTGAGLSWTG